MDEEEICGGRKIKVYKAELEDGGIENREGEQLVDRLEILGAPQPGRVCSWDAQHNPCHRCPLSLPLITPGRCSLTTRTPVPPEVRVAWLASLSGVPSRVRRWELNAKLHNAGRRGNNESLRCPESRYMSQVFRHGCAGEECMLVVQEIGRCGKIDELKHYRRYQLLICVTKLNTVWTTEMFGVWDVCVY